jgi:hypothetical protein
MDLRPNEKRGIEGFGGQSILTLRISIVIAKTTAAVSHIGLTIIVDDLRARKELIYGIAQQARPLGRIYCSLIERRIHVCGRRRLQHGY